MSAARESPRRAGAGFDTAPRDEYPPVAEVAALLPPVEAVDGLPPESLPGLIAGLAALQARAAARLAVSILPPPPANDPPEHDMIADVREVARIVRRSVSWVRHNGHTLPGFSQPGGKGFKVLWSRRALTEWIAGETFPLTGARKRA